MIVREMVLQGIKIKRLVLCMLEIYFEIVKV